ncbi:PorV/PorQ family protein [candidate division KSB1 bacterium]|nr:PorV/PorQ family protein [candidate division KSB1 bacterium]
MICNENKSAFDNGGVVMIKRTFIVFSIVLIALTFISINAYAQKKLAQTGFQFLSVGADARAAALGDAFTTIEGNSGALFYNPAGIARTNKFVDLSANYTDWIADIKHYAFSMTLSPQNGKYGVFGLTVMAVDYGDIQGTMVWGNSQGYIDTEIFQPRAFAIGIGYGRSLTDKFSVGGQIKQVAQDLGKSVVPDEETKNNVASAIAFDFGTIYRTGFKSLTFGMSVRNFSDEVKFEKEGFQLPLTFKVGWSADMLDFFYDDHEEHSFVFSMDAAHPRSYPEYLAFGGEYTFIDMFALRVGYVSNQDEYGTTLGFGFNTFGLQIDYGYTPFGIFDSVHRFTFHFAK